MFTEMSSYVMVGFWWAASILAVVLALLHEFSSKLPQFFQDLLLYGKVRGDRKEWSIVQVFEVPKRFVLSYFILNTVFVP